MSDADTAPKASDWILGDIAVDENGKLHTYKYSMLLSFSSLEEFQAARKLIDPLLFKS